ncbi:MAG: nucleotidyl transferase AbiEii/AbiGii toxin family protein [Verrucomicrobiota bacterium]
MSTFAKLATQERADFVREASARLDVLPVIVEKDFWVCWMLQQIFQSPTTRTHLVFKGGTSLSKVFGAIKRFSEDIDLSIAPELLGWKESELDDAPTLTQRRKRLEKLEAACIAKVQAHFQPELEKSVRAALGRKSDNGNWLSYERDATSKSPVLLFNYPSVLPAAGGYIQPFVKVEFGSLTDQRPTGVHLVKPLLAEVIEAGFEDFQIKVVALEVERTFWEKATILHSEHHRPANQSIRERFARHYADVAALWEHPARSVALARLDLLARVVKHKSRFFASNWANYESAKPGSLKLVPPSHRESDLAQDYDRMQTMFLIKPPSFSEVLRVLFEAEREINKL